MLIILKKNDNYIQQCGLLHPQTQNNRNHQNKRSHQNHQNYQHHYYPNPSP
jgi:hypothetical protein